MRRSRTIISHRAALTPSASAVLVLAVVLSGTVACSAPSGAGTAGGAPAAGSAASSPAAGLPAAGLPGAATDAATPAASPEAPAPGSASGAGASDAKARLEAALRGVTAAVRRPGTEQIRAAITAAGFPADGVEITAGRTPTGLDAAAVEAAVRAGGSCIIGQLRDGNVTTVVLPVLADGRCLVGATR